MSHETKKSSICRRRLPLSSPSPHPELHVSRVAMVGAIVLTSLPLRVPPDPNPPYLSCRTGRSSLSGDLDLRFRLGAFPLESYPNSPCLSPRPRRSSLPANADIRFGAGASALGSSSRRGSDLTEDSLRSLLRPNADEDEGPSPPDSEGCLEDVERPNAPPLLFS